jgi:hypothetical protein
MKADYKASAIPGVDESLSRFRESDMMLSGEGKDKSW